MNRGLLLLIVASTLVLVSGETIDVSGPISEIDGRLVFRSSGGTLYSLRASEVDAAATKKLEDDRARAVAGSAKKLKVTPEQRDRLLAELAKNRKGQPPEPQKLLTAPPPEASPRDRDEEQDEEWRWRRTAREYEENVRRAEEQLQLLLDREAQLDNEIRGFLSLGYRPRQFSYQTTELFRVREQIPGAELAIRQAQRARDDFREDARRQGVMPGWLR